MLRVQAYVQRANEFQELNIPVVFVGHGGKKKGKQYVQMLSMEDRVPLYTDPKRVTHRALGLTDLSWIQLLSDSEGYALSKQASKKGLKAAMIGTGSVTQLGGVALITKENGIEFFHKCHTTHDYPEVDDLLALCKRQ